MLLRSVFDGTIHYSQIVSTAKFLLDLTLLSIHQVQFAPSMRAASALFIARQIWDQPGWTLGLAYYSKYSQRDLRTCTEHMARTLSKASVSKHQVSYVWNPVPVQVSIMKWWKILGKFLLWLHSFMMATGLYSGAPSGVISRLYVLVGGVVAGLGILMPFPSSWNSPPHPSPDLVMWNLNSKDFGRLTWPIISKLNCM